MRASSMIVAIAFLVACGDNIKPEVPDVVPIVCGNGLLEEGEDCDDDDALKDSVCDATCQFTCGNGVVDDDVGELCDTSIASGAGACPSSCDDGMACTDDVLSSSDCTAVCLHSDITAPADGDGCCPASGDANTDSDCTAVCGNSVVEPGELCDTGITAGAGACPTSCNDMQVCTTDMLNNPGTCMASCSASPITMPDGNGGDGCCPTGANSNNDDDCVAVCGNGVVEATETCDTGIASGPGACPTMCDDGMACTTDTLGNAGTCQAVCLFPPITAPTNGDGCCPTGANANNDNDCMPSCGNGVPEMGEQCDDGNADDTDACGNDCMTNIVPTAFRFTDLDARDPHIFVSILFSCQDVTNSNPFFSVNEAIRDAIQLDGNSDGLLDFSPTLVFRPFSPTATTMPLELHFANCTAPESSTACSPSGGMVTTATATNMTTGTCLAPVPGTTRATYSPAISSPTAPCFVTSPVTVTLSLGGIPITLRDAQVAASYLGNPVNQMANGLLRGFISEADANATIIPASFPIVGGKPLSTLLPGGTGACPSFSDKDTHNGVVGWWFYLNFPAARVPWMD